MGGSLQSGGNVDPLNMAVAHSLYIVGVQRMTNTWNGVGDMCVCTVATMCIFTTVLSNS